jgi:hypothetical protein
MTMMQMSSRRPEEWKDIHVTSYSGSGSSSGSSDDSDSDDDLGDIKRLLVPDFLLSKVVEEEEGEEDEDEHNDNENEKADHADYAIGKTSSSTSSTATGNSSEDSAFLLLMDGANVNDVNDTEEVTIMLQICDRLKDAVIGEAVDGVGCVVCGDGGCGCGCGDGDGSNVVVCGNVYVDAVCSSIHAEDVLNDTTSAAADYTNEMRDALLLLFQLLLLDEEGNASIGVISVNRITDMIMCDQNHQNQHYHPKEHNDGDTVTDNDNDNNINKDKEQENIFHDITRAIQEEVINVLWTEGIHSMFNCKGNGEHTHSTTTTGTANHDYDDASTLTADQDHHNDAAADNTKANAAKDNEEHHHQRKEEEGTAMTSDTAAAVYNKVRESMMLLDQQQGIVSNREGMLQCTPTGNISTTMITSSASAASSSSAEGGMDTNDTTSTIAITTNNCHHDQHDPSSKDHHVNTTPVAVAGQTTTTDDYDALLLAEAKAYIGRRQNSEPNISTAASNVELLPVDHHHEAAGPGHVESSLLDDHITKVDAANYLVDPQSAKTLDDILATLDLNLNDISIFDSDSSHYDTNNNVEHGIGIDAETEDENENGNDNDRTVSSRKLLTRLPLDLANKDILLPVASASTSLLRRESSHESESHTQRFEEQRAADQECLMDAATDKTHDAHDTEHHNVAYCSTSDMQPTPSAIISSNDVANANTTLLALTSLGAAESILIDSIYTDIINNKNSVVTVDITPSPSSYSNSNISNSNHNNLNLYDNVHTMLEHSLMAYALAFARQKACESPEGAVLFAELMILPLTYAKVVSCFVQKRADIERLMCFSSNIKASSSAAFESFEMNQITSFYQVFIDDDDDAGETQNERLSKRKYREEHQVIVEAGDDDEAELVYYICLDHSRKHVVSI